VPGFHHRVGPRELWQAVALGAGRTVVNAEHADGALLLIDAEDDPVPAGAVS